VALKDLGLLEVAEESYRRALDLKPDYAEAWNNLGIVLMELGRSEEAEASYRRVLLLHPGHALAHSNLGNALQAQGRFEEAVSSYRRALELDSGYAGAYGSLGNVLRHLGHIDAALDCIRRAMELGHADPYSRFLFMRNCSESQADPSWLDQAREFGRMVSWKAAERFTEWSCEAAPTRLRVGMVSGDYSNHPVGYFLEGLLAAMDPERIELIAYTTGSRSDDLTARIRPYFSGWKSLVGLNDKAAAQLIHDDGVHVLLDLAGHTAMNRLPVFAWKPAPVQASWLGYFATTGVAEMDYLLADEVGVPEAQRGDFTERVWYLPDTRLCFTPPAYDLAVSPPPALAKGHVTFGCFQRLDKVNDAVLAVWGRILGALPDARLRWQCKWFGDATVKAGLCERLRQHGIDPARVDLVGPAPRQDYLAAHAEVDMTLDTFPYTGGTTTCEALWMGVPTVTLAGGTLLARQGASLLTAAGLVDWVAESEDEYVAKALGFAADLDGLSRLRASLRERVLASPVFDAGRFARNFEDALWGMWQRAS
jgi:predicted O-linked N-acetylglucosamine transferase (SPINDLY family)